MIPNKCCTKRCFGSDHGAISVSATPVQKVHHNRNLNTTAPKHAKLNKA